MRVFVAIPVSPALQNEIAKWCESLLHSQPSFAKATEGAMRWLSGKNLHVTLVPPWEEEPARVPEVLTHLREAVGVLREPLVLSFSRVRFGPDPRRPRLIWAG